MYFEEVKCGLMWQLCLSTLVTITFLFSQKGEEGICSVQFLLHILEVCYRTQQTLLNEMTSRDETVSSEKSLGV